ncbi:MAG: alcohol dehydrogenase catalytic domain-containing protein [bacterium]
MEKTMLAVVKEKAEPGVVVKQIPVPSPEPGELLIKVKAASICGTDIGIYDWTPWAADHIKPPIVIGHEVLGEVLEINGESDKIKIGDLVSSETHIFCGKCFQCQNNRRHICENMQLFGIGRNGGFAEYATIPIRTSWKNDPAIPLDWMSVQEPFGNAVHAITKASVTGKRVVIFGMGPTGLAASAVAKANDASEVIGIDPVEYRRNLAMKMGCDNVFDILPAEYDNQVDIVIDMSGFPPAIERAFDAVRIGGVLMAFGIPKTKIEIDWGKYLINKELTILSVFGRHIWETWEETTRLLKSGKINLDPIITHRFPLAQFEEAMAVMKSGQSGKIVLTP